MIPDFVKNQQQVYDENAMKLSLMFWALLRSFVGKKGGRKKRAIFFTGITLAEFFKNVTGAR